MGKPSRSVHIVKNMSMGSLKQISRTLFSFVGRSVFIYTISVEYLGINGLFSNILSLLSMADLGFGAAIVYSMYRPIAENDLERQTALMNYYRKVYMLIAVVVAVIGLALIPVLPYTVNLQNDIPHLRLYYLLYLANTVMTYLFVYKTSIAIAHQKAYRMDGYEIAVLFVQTALQIVFLLCFHSFLLYLVTQVAGTALSNLIKGRMSQKMYPYIKGGAKLDQASRKEIRENAGSMFFYKMGAAILNYTDNILISIMIGTIWVGYYSNYAMVVSSISAILTVAFSSVTATFGNLNASESMERRFEGFRTLQLVCWWLYSFCAICFLVLLQDFITLWMQAVGKEYLLNMTTVLSIVLAFYLPGTIVCVSIFRDTTGMFRQTKYIYFGTSILNLVLSVLLGKVMGLTGILLATSLARLLSNVWFEPSVLMRKYFHLPVFQFFSPYLRLWLIFLSGAAITWLTAQLLTAPPVVTFLYKIAVCVVVPNVFFIFTQRNTREFRFILQKLLLLIKRA